MDAPVDTSQTPAKRKPNKRRAPARIDHRYALGRRVLSLVRTLEERVGEDRASDPLVSAAIRRCAETTALAEDLRARMLRGDETVKPLDVVRMTRVAETMTRGLGLMRHPQRSVSGVQSLDAYLGAKR